MNWKIALIFVPLGYRVPDALARSANERPLASKLHLHRSYCPPCHHTFARMTFSVKRNDLR